MVFKYFDQVFVTTLSVKSAGFPFNPTRATQEWTPLLSCFIACVTSVSCVPLALVAYFSCVAGVT